MFNDLQVSRDPGSYKDWYSPGAIKFRFKEIEWVLSHWDIINAGLWPPKGQEDIVKGSVSSHAYFEAPMDIAAEISFRLEQTGEDGELAKRYYTDGMTEIELARKAKLDPLDILNRIHSAILYMTRWPRKKESYKAWLQQDYRKNDC